MAASALVTLLDGFGGDEPPKEVALQQRPQWHRAAGYVQVWAEHPKQRERAVRHAQLRMSWMRWRE